MPLPTMGQVHVDALLSNVAEKFLLEDTAYVADKIFPLVPVKKERDLIAQYDRGDFFRLVDVRPRSPGTESQGVGYRVVKDRHYFCRQYATHIDVPDEVKANADAPFDPDRDATEVCTQLLKLKRDELFRSMCFAAAFWTNAYTGVVGVPAAGQVRQWQDYVNSTPITDIENAKLAIHAITGFQPNVLLINKLVWSRLKHHPTVINRYVQTQAVPILTQQQVANVFGIDRIVVAEAIQNTGPEGGPNVFTPIFGNHAMLCYVQPAPSTTRPSAGYSFSYTGANYNGLNIQMERYRAPLDAKFDRIVGTFWIDVQIVEPDLGAFFTNVAA